MHAYTKYRTYLAELVEMLPTPDHVLGFKGYGEDMFSGVRDLVSHQEDLDARPTPCRASTPRRY